MATDQLSEQEIQFRKRARRRLVGAIALVLLMVTILPMVLDDQEAKGPQPDIAISIPSQDGGDFTSKIVPITPTAPVPEKPAPKVQLASPLEKPQPEPPVTTPAKKPEAIQPKPVESESPKIQAHTQPPEVKKPEAVKQVPASAAAAETAAAPAKEVPHPRVAATEKPAAKKSGFSVQVGVFSDAAKVKQLQDKLAAQGLQSYTEKLNTPKGVMLRLRSGPYTNRDDAEKVRDKLKALGLAGMVVANK